MSQSTNSSSIASVSVFNESLFEMVIPWLNGRVLEVNSMANSLSSVFVQKGRRIHLSNARKGARDLLRATYAGNEAVRYVHAIDFYLPDFEQVFSKKDQLFNTILALNPNEIAVFDPKIVLHACHLLPKDGHLILLAPTFTALYDRLPPDSEELKTLHHRYTNALFPDGMRLLMTKYICLEHDDLYKQPGISVLAVAFKR